MQFEIIHDTVANLVYAKASSNAQNRRKIERYIRDKHQQKLDDGYHLSQDDLDYIQPYLDQISLSPEQLDFIAEETRLIKQTARRKQGVIVGVMSVIVFLASFSMVKYLALRQATIALVQSEIAEVNQKIQAWDLAGAEKQLQQAMALERELGVSVNTPNLWGIPISFRQGPNAFLAQNLELLYIYLEAAKPTEAFEVLKTIESAGGKEILTDPIRDSLAYLQSRFAQLADDSLQLHLATRYYPSMLPLPAGRFWMGALATDTEAKQDEFPAHQVELSAFEMSRLEVSVYQYALYCLANDLPLPFEPPWGVNGQLPIVNVAWRDALDYGRWLSDKKQANYRLPTEAEWEYAAIGGRDSAVYTYAGSNTLAEIAWTMSDSVASPQSGGQKQSNALGFFDLNGNVMEWCLDGYGDYSDSLDVQLNPQGNADPYALKIARGGDYDHGADRSRVNSRLAYDPRSQYRNLGFRIVKTP